MKTKTLPKMDPSKARDKLKFDLGRFDSITRWMDHLDSIDDKQDSDSHASVYAHSDVAQEIVDTIRAAVGCPDNAAAAVAMGDSIIVAIPTCSGDENGDTHETSGDHDFLILPRSALIDIDPSEEADEG